jgi:hypothetical protein
MSRPSSRLEQPLLSQRAQSHGGHHTSSQGVSMQWSCGSLSATAHTSPPPPPPPALLEYDPWNPRNAHTVKHSSAFEGAHGSPVRSEASKLNLAGSDLETDTVTKPIDENGQATDGSTMLKSIPKLERSDSSFSRKRSYGDTDQSDEKTRQLDDHTKRKRRSEIADVYSRR